MNRNDTTDGVLSLLVLGFIGYVVWQEYQKFYGQASAAGFSVGDRTQGIREAIIEGAQRTRGKVGEIGLPSDELIDVII